MTPTVEERAALQARVMAAIPHARAIGIEVLGVEGKTFMARVPFREDLVGDPEARIIAGGVVTTLLDHIGGSAVALALREFRSIATLDLRIDYMRPAAPGAGVTAEAQCTKITRSVAFIRAVAYDQTKDDPVATAVGVYMLGATRFDAPWLENGGEGVPPEARRAQPALHAESGSDPGGVRDGGKAAPASHAAESQAGGPP